MYEEQIDDWLQVKGDPAVRALVFEQTRAQSLFDEKFDRLIQVGEILLARHGVYQLMIHFSSNQLICWTYENPYSYKVYVLGFPRYRIGMPQCHFHLQTCQIPLKKSIIS